MGQLSGALRPWSLMPLPSLAPMRPVPALLVALALLTGCPTIGKGDLAARVDLDDDGYVSDQFEGDDCNDDDGTVNPGATDAPYDGVDADCSGNSDNDGDSDGYDDVGHGGDDCDDANPAVHPGAVEICDGLDDDCNGVTGDASSPDTDESDSDGDGFLVCAGTLAADCDDTNPAVNPGAPEVCDDANADEDCDGSTDDGDTSATGQVDWFLDDDQDTFGTPETVASRCDEPTGYVSNSDDCDDTDAAVNPDTPWYVDADEDGFGDETLEPLTSCVQPDGYVIDAGDCDDGDAAVSPGVLETCNDVDDNCNGLVDAADPDVDPTEALWYRDRDADGYGDDAVSVVTCEDSAGYVHEGGDCDDAVANIYPGASETCDTEDNDCDGAIDDADGDVVGQSTWYLDLDDDEFGDAGATRIACFQPSTYVASDADCDDGDVAINPSAQEVCDSVDNDCDAAVDDADPSVAPGAVTYTDADLDGYGDDATATTLCVPPSGNVSIAGDCDDSLASANPSEAETWYDWIDEDCDGADDFDQDADGDDDLAYGGGDCDDTDPTIASTLAEVWYDGVDQDCDLADDFDQDGDGWEWGDDCDDVVAVVNPGELEDCGTVADDDCTGSTNDVGATRCTGFFEDLDGDGYGVGASVCMCQAEGVLVALVDADCDDTALAVNPGVVEVCRDGVDDDCDGGAGRAS